MKRSIVVLLALLVLLAPLAAQDRAPALDPKTARSLGMGGAFIALSEGYASLYGNPAGFADPKGHLYLPSVSAWTYVAPSSGNLDKVFAIAAGDANSASYLNDLLTENGFGFGFQAGFGYSGGGLGLGVFAVADSYAVGENALGATMTLDSTLQAVLGLGLPVDLFGLRIQVGGDVRPFYRASGAMAFSEVAGILLGSGGDLFGSLMDETAMAGFGFALDLGASAELGPFKLGLAIRDIAPAFPMALSTYGEILESGGAMPAGTTYDFALAPNVVLGASFRPFSSALAAIVDPVLLVELQDPVAIIENEVSAWSLLHVGLETRVLGFMVARAGLNKGWISLGGGIDLAILQIDAAVFTEELGRRPGDAPRSGIALDLTFRL